MNNRITLRTGASVPFKEALAVLAILHMWEEQQEVLCALLSTARSRNPARGVPLPANAPEELHERCHRVGFFEEKETGRLRDIVAQVAAAALHDDPDGGVMLVNPVSEGRRGHAKFAQVFHREIS